MRRNLAGAELTEIELWNLEDPIQPLEIEFSMLVAGYAARTQSRLLVAPAVFNQGVAPPFSAGERRSDMVFPFRYSNFDEVVITYPLGFEPEAPSAPSSVDFGPLGRFETQLSIDRVKREITSTRSFRIDAISVNQSSYLVVKRRFEQRRDSDDQVVALRRRSEAKNAPATRD